MWRAYFIRPPPLTAPASCTAPEVPSLDPPAHLALADLQYHGGNAFCPRVVDLEDGDVLGLSDTALHSLPPIPPRPVEMMIVTVKKIKKVNE